MTGAAGAVTPMWPAAEQRTILCAPDRVAAVQAEVDRRGLAGCVTVAPSSLLPDADTIYWLDTHKLEAILAETLGGPQRGVFAKRAAV